MPATKLSNFTSVASRTLPRSGVTTMRARRRRPDVTVATSVVTSSGRDGSVGLVERICIGIFLEDICLRLGRDFQRMEDRKVYEIRTRKRINVKRRDKKREGEK